MKTKEKYPNIQCKLCMKKGGLKKYLLYHEEEIEEHFKKCHPRIYRTLEAKHDVI